MSKKAIMVDLRKVTLGVEYDENQPLRVVLGIPAKEDDADGVRPLQKDKIVDITDDFEKVYGFVHGVIVQKVAELSQKGPKIGPPKPIVPFKQEESVEEREADD